MEDTTETASVSAASSGTLAGPCDVNGVLFLKIKSCKTCGLRKILCCSRTLVCSLKWAFGNPSFFCSDRFGYANRKYQCDASCMFIRSLNGSRLSEPLSIELGKKLKPIFVLLVQVHTNTHQCVSDTGCESIRPEFHGNRSSEITDNALAVQLPLCLEMYLNFMQ